MTDETVDFVDDPFTGGVEDDPGDSDLVGRLDPEAYPGVYLPQEESETSAPQYEWGDREQFSKHWFNQSTNGHCVPASVAQIVSEYTDLDIGDESAFVEYALQQGFYPDGDDTTGMSMESGASLLEAAGVPAHVESGSIEALASYLDNGYGVMVAVDSGEYWDPLTEQADETTGTDAGGDHCVVVSEIDAAAGVVYLSDPGSPDGNQAAVSLDTFLEAWGESQNEMIVCDEPSPGADTVTDDDDVQSVADVDPVTDAAHSADAGAVAEITATEVADTRDRDDSSALQDVVEWVTRQPWVLLPVLMQVGSFLR